MWYVLYMCCSCHIVDDVLLFSICQSLSTFLLEHKRFSSSKQYLGLILLSAKLYDFFCFFLLGSFLYKVDISYILYFSKKTVAFLCCNCQYNNMGHSNMTSRLFWHLPSPFVALTFIQWEQSAKYNWQWNMVSWDIRR